MMETKEGFRSGFITMIGRPNMGKSTLINALIGEKMVITSDKPQTTRNRIHCVLTRDDAQLVFIDTPGIHKPHDKMGEYLVKTAYESLNDVDVVLFLVDAKYPPGKGDQFILNQIQGIKTPILLVLNKIDLITPKELSERIKEYERFSGFPVIPISALKGQNLDTLVDAIVEYLPEGPMYYPADMITDQLEQFIVAEIIREKVLHLTRDEVPHSVAVEIEEMAERSNDKMYIRATIYVERNSQKGILIGKNGRMLKKIGQLARKDIEGLLAVSTYLDLWVKVKKDWREREDELKRLGYRE
ncbi:GTPase Era [Anoxybacter fermentans]|uniref:GTPase Era n=1 Tax=Anoxybacter fermentans TaxID=1323375 RepID=A0A3Q9HRY5_9FIRM|nr:GTPase Era [Anoxybacter fermentans]AZR73148.1 GTPase Era [Anoxybacter fermentans]